MVVIDGRIIRWYLSLGFSKLDHSYIISIKYTVLSKKSQNISLPNPRSTPFISQSISPVAPPPFQKHHTTKETHPLTHLTPQALPPLHRLLLTHHPPPHNKHMSAALQFPSLIQPDRSTDIDVLSCRLVTGAEGVEVREEAGDAHGEGGGATGGGDGGNDDAGGVGGAVGELHGVVVVVVVVVVVELIFVCLGSCVLWEDRKSVV